VSAPPGYGKSVALAGWLAAVPVPHAWLTLDAADNDPVRFTRYLVGALRSVRPAVAATTRSLFGATAATDLAALLIDAIAQDDDPFVLVFDDYHVITAEPVHALVRLLVEQGPPFMRLVVSTREDPPVPLARLRAHGRLVEVRADDLRLTLEETGAYLAGSPGLDLDAAHIARLYERTEGWFAGVQLAAISMQDRSDAAALVDAVAGSQRFVLDYLAAEVLDRLDPDLRGFIVRVSVADRFTADLCLALTGRIDSAALLDRAERLNLFLVPLDPERRWYRFHHLFRDYLRSLLEEAERRALHARASAYLERMGLAGEAIDQALAAGSIDRAVRLLEREGYVRYQAEELMTLLGWLEALPLDRVTASPVLAALYAAALFFTGRLAEAVTACEASEAVLEARGKAAGGLRAVRALVAMALGRDDAAALAQAALQVLPSDDALRPLALQALGTAQVVEGDLTTAVATMRSALEAGLASGQSMVAVPALTMLATALNLTGRRREAEGLCRRILADFEGTAGPLHGGVAYAACWLGMLRYEANDLVEARRELERGWEAVGRFGHGRVLLGTSVAYLALVRLATGYPAEAFEALATFRHEARVAGLGVMDSTFAEIEARLHVFAGDAAAAVAWADAAEGQVASRWSGLATACTIARVRLAQRRPLDAGRHLRSARTAAEKAGDVADLVTVAVLEAVHAEQLGERREAQRALEASIRLASPEHYTRRIVDDGRAVAHLLPAVRRIAPALVDEVAGSLAAQGAFTTASRPRRGVSLWRDAGGELLEALTARELEVLHLMAAGHTDAAIADDLVVSLATAKWHASHVRAKLGVKSRTQALLRAQQLGLV